MNSIFRLNGSTKRHPAVEQWLVAHAEPMANVARQWFDVIRNCGDDVTELLHDGFATACLGDAPFAYVGVYTAHVNVGFFQGANLIDPVGLLKGTGKYMRHVRIKPTEFVDDGPLIALIEAAYADMKHRLS
jgi:hypothetical protein